MFSCTPPPADLLLLLTTTQHCLQRLSTLSPRTTSSSFSRLSALVTLAAHSLLGRRRPHNIIRGHNRLPAAAVGPGIFRFGCQIEALSLSCRSRRPRLRESDVHGEMNGMQVWRRHRCFLETLLHFRHMYSSVSCLNATQEKQLQLHTFASACFSVIACLGRPICPAAVVLVG